MLISLLDGALERLKIQDWNYTDGELAADLYIKPIGLSHKARL